MTENNKNGSADLQQLLRNMAPVLNEGDFVFLSFPDTVYGSYAWLKPIAAFVEAEGLTLVVLAEMARQHALQFDGEPFKCITLQVHSSLEAVGLTAAFSSKLAEHNISANVIAGFFHDHIFVSKSDAENAMKALQQLSADAGTPSIQI